MQMKKDYVVVKLEYVMCTGIRPSSIDYVSAIEYLIGYNCF